MATVLLVATASAGPAHKFSGRFSVPGTTGSSNLVAIDRDSRTGDLLALDASNNNVLRFSGAETLVDSFGPGASPDAATATYGDLAYDPDNDDIYLVNRSSADRPSGSVDRFDSDGTYLSTITSAAVPGGVFQAWAAAVDPTNGDLYVANNALCGPTGEPSSVVVFDETGAAKPAITGEGTDGALVCPSDVAVDGLGNVYVLDIGVGSVKRFTTAGVYDATLYFGFPQAIEVDAATGELYVDEGPQIVQHDAAGSPVFTFGAGQLGFSPSMVLNDANDRAYALDGPSVAFFDAATAPNVTTEAPSGETTDGATLNGTVDPLGVPDTTYRFEYGLDTSYGSSTPDTPTAGGPVSADVRDLQPNTTYHYRIVGSNPDVSNAGVDQTFTTVAVPPTVGSEAVDNLRSTSAILKAAVNPHNNTSTRYRFEYGTDDRYGSTVPATGPDFDLAVVDPQADHAVSTTLTGLQSETTYHWRIVASNGIDPPVEGADQTFRTLQPIPTATMGAVTGIGQTSATFNATVDTKGLSGTAFFTVTSSTSAFTESTAPVTVADTLGAQQVTASLGGLPAGTLLHVRATVVTDGGSDLTPNVDFTTAATQPFVPPPIVPDLNPYGCVAPHLNAYNARARPGQTITLTGSDLGIGGVLTFGATEADTPSWTSTGITAQVPSSARGSVGVTANCGKASNVITVRVVAKKKARKCKKGFVKKKVKGKTRCVKKKKAKKRKRR